MKWFAHKGLFADLHTGEQYTPIVAIDDETAIIDGKPEKFDRLVAQVFGPDREQVAAEIVKRYEAHEKLLRKLDLAADALAKIRPNSIIVDSARLLLKELEGQ